MVVINEIECKSILNRSRIPGVDYAVNPYVGCQHGCVYCYARFMIRYTKHNAEWGSFVDVKINAPSVIKKQLMKLPRGLVSLSTVTDPYQIQEKKYSITRQLLVELATHRFPVSILTKSDLVLRDVDILKQFQRNECEVGFSITTLDETVRQYFEPNAPVIKSRINALKELHKQGIQTWVFLAPILPILTMNVLYDLLNEIKHSIDYLLVDKLNIKCGNWQRISKVLRHTYPSLLPQWKDALFSEEKRKSYYQIICNRIVTYCDQKRIKVRFCNI